MQNIQILSILELLTWSKFYLAAVGLPCIVSFNNFKGQTLEQLQIMLLYCRIILIFLKWQVVLTIKGFYLNANTAILIVAFTI